MSIDFDVKFSGIVSFEIAACGDQIKGAISPNAINDATVALLLLRVREVAKQREGAYWILLDTLLAFCQPGPSPRAIGRRSLAQLGYLTLI
jgi:hypothetical protein